MPRKWLTPDSDHDGLTCYQVVLPKGVAWEAAFKGAFLLLCDSFNWEEYGSITSLEAAAAFSAAFFDTFQDFTECP